MIEINALINRVIIYSTMVTTGLVPIKVLYNPNYWFSEKAHNAVELDTRTKLRVVFVRTAHFFLSTTFGLRRVYCFHS